MQRYSRALLVIAVVILVAIGFKISNHFSAPTAASNTTVNTVQ